jgi:hypothetical protein
MRNSLCLEKFDESSQYLSVIVFEMSSPQSSNRCARLRESDRTLRDGSFGWPCPRHFVPGYDRTVPPGRVRLGNGLGLGRSEPARSRFSLAWTSNLRTIVFVPSIVLVIELERSNSYSIIPFFPWLRVGSCVVRGAAGKPRFGRSLSLPLFHNATS